MYPMEPAAGMDMVELRKKYGQRIAFKGGIDKHVLRQSKEEIRKELEYKMQPLMLGQNGFLNREDNSNLGNYPLKLIFKRIITFLPESVKHGHIIFVFYPQLNSIT